MNDTKMNSPAGKDRPQRLVTRVPMIAPLPKRKKVAAYARVSADKDASLHSLAAQVSYYSSYIQSRKDWEYAGVYADEGISGTRASRPEFQRLLKDCREGKIDMILVKSISRFARNTVTMLETVRELKALGIDILFEKENIHSMSGDGELMLTILASFAQAEAQSVSENCRWRIRKNFEAGIPVSTLIYGFKMKKGKFTVVPHEAEIIREIFDMYLDGMGRTLIAMNLNERGIPSPLGMKWHPGEIYVILTNEKYVGDLLMQKYYVQDYLTKKMVRNRGEREFYFVENDHEGIVPRAVFDLVQLEIERKADKFSPWKDRQGEKEDTAHLKRPDGKYLFTRKITCGVCGSSFCRKKVNAGTVYANAAWVCNTYGTLGKKGCASRRVPENVLIPIIAGLLNISEESLPDMMDRVDGITIFPDGRLQAVLDGKEYETAWANASRRESWNDERRKRASEQMKETWKRRKAK